MKNSTILISLLIVILFALLFSFSGNDDNNNNVDSSITVEEALKNIFQTENVRRISELLYSVDQKNYYVKNIEDFDGDGLEEVVVMEPQVKSGKIYKFYKEINGNFSLVGEASSLIWYLEEEKNKEIELLVKDVTGDSTPEVFIPLQENASGNRWYTVLRFSPEDAKLDNILFRHHSESKPSISVSFDELDYKDNRLAVTWHGVYSRGITYYRLENSIFTDEKTLGLFGQPRSEEYEYREIDENGNIIYREKRTGSVWTNPIERLEVP